MNDMTVEDALDYLDNVCVCHGCECWQDHDWGGCYRTTTTGKMACDLRDEAVEVLRKVVFRAMGVTDIHVGRTERTAKVSNQIFRDRPNAVGAWIGTCECGALVTYSNKYCSQCGCKLDWGS